MKKHLIAAAVAAAVAAPAFAQSSVEVYGILDIGYTNTDTDTKGSVGFSTGGNDFVASGKQSVESSTSGNYGAYTSQRLGFRGTEDLGGGIKASFNYELGLGRNDEAASLDGGPDPDSNDDADAGTADGGILSVRQANVSLSGGFGTLKVGRMTTQADIAWGVGDVGGGNNFFGRAYTSYGKFNNSRSSRLIEYTTPTFNGFSAAIQYGKRKDKTSGTVLLDNTTDNSPTDAASAASGNAKASFTETGLGLRYSAGPLAVMAGYSSEEGKANGATTQKPRQFVLAGNYDLGMAKVFVTYADGSNKGNSVAVPAGTLVKQAAGTAGTNFGTSLTNSKTDADAVEVGVSVPMGQWTFNASYFTGDRKTKGTIATGATTSAQAEFKSDIDGYQLAALYGFSKRTTLYAVYGSAEAKTKGTAGYRANVETDQFGVGLRHSF